MKVERNRAGNKYTFTPEDKEDEKFLDKVNKKIDELEEENRKLKEYNGELIENHKKDIAILCEENRKLKEENELLKQCLDKLMFDADVVNVKIHGELGDYVYVRSDRQFKLNVKD